MENGLARLDISDEKEFDGISLLCIVMDTNPSQNYLKENPQNVPTLIDSVITFANSHLMQRSQNMLAVLACHHTGTHYLYPKQGKPLEVRPADGQYEVFSVVEKTIKCRLNEIFNASPTLTEPCESLLAGSMAMALAYINRIQRTLSDDVKKVKARILVITGSNECASQYMTFMNVFFTCQKLEVVIDVCAMGHTLNLLHQGCDLTGGQFLKLPHFDGLLQHLIWVFLPDPDMRKKLLLPPADKVDYRAACFCHRELVDIGFVCSVCLSIYCKVCPICTTCQTTFTMPTVPMKNKRKKKHTNGTSNGTY